MKASQSCTVEEPRELAAREEANGKVETQFLILSEAGGPLVLKSGRTLSPVRLAFEVYGAPNPDRSNVVLLFHALTGSQHAAGYNPAVEGAGDLWTKECRDGWWNDFIGPGKALDTEKFCVVCINYLGGCYGSTGPTSLSPLTLTPYGSSFPEISFSDMVDTQIRWLDHFRIRKLHAVIGSSTGALLTLNLATRYPERVERVIPIAGGLNVTALQKILIFEQIYALEQDPAFQGGDYYDGPLPRNGLAHARMISHKTFIAPETLDERVFRRISQPEKGMEWYRLRHPLESYMLHQGMKFARRFDANAYLRILDAWSGFDLLKDTGASDYTALLTRCRGQRFLQFSIDSDGCFPPREQEKLDRFLGKAGVPREKVDLQSLKGHDAFLVEPALFAPQLNAFLGV